MRIDLSFSASSFDELQLRDKNVIVIDVLRSSTTVAAALNNGAREIIPVASIESAVKISGSLFGEVTLRGGERNGKIIEGFNLGNSPREYTESTVRGKSIIFCTTNGSVAMAKSRYAKNMAVASFVNLTRVVEYMKEINNDFWIVCAGKAMGLGSFSLEDAVCAGMILDRLEKENSLPMELSDSSRAAQLLHKSLGRSLLKMMKNSDHGQYLKEIGFEEDIKVCAAVDSIPVLPVLSGNVLKLRKDDRAPESELAQGTK
ncbi:MAG: 2-phosphosulfolactate phosphatase [Ignavibacteriales bacterium]|nr:2-phosphosulfolactate phosphatase [Ignavibacteriales bacterium]